MKACSDPQKIRPLFKTSYVIIRRMTSQKLISKGCVAVFLVFLGNNFLYQHIQSTTKDENSITALVKLGALRGGICCNNVVGKFDRFTLDCKNHADLNTGSLCCNVSRRKSLCICAEKPKTPRMPMMHCWCKAPCLCFWCPAPLTSGVPLMHWGRHYFCPGMVQQYQAPLVCPGCSAQCTMIGIPGRHAAVHHWHVTGMPPGCGGQPRACPSLQLAAARPRAAQEGGWMGTGEGGERGEKPTFPTCACPHNPPPTQDSGLSPTDGQLAYDRQPSHSFQICVLFQNETFNINVSAVKMRYQVSGIKIWKNVTL